MNATIKLHVQNVSNALPFMMQEVRVHFYMANNSTENLIELSGNLGYINGLPVIASYASNNYSDHFF